MVAPVNLQLVRDDEVDKAIRDEAARYTEKHRRKGGVQEATDQHLSPDHEASGREQTPAPKKKMQQRAAKLIEELACTQSACNACVKTRQDGYGHVHCPTHDDQHPSLSVKIENGRVLVHCFAGCAQQVVLDE